MRRHAVQRAEQPEGRDAQLDVPRRVDLFVAKPLPDNEHVAVDGDHRDAHERDGEAREDHVTEDHAQGVGDGDRVADEGRGHGHGAQDEIGGRQITQVDVRHTAEGASPRDGHQRQQVADDAETEEAEQHDPQR